MYPGGLQSRPRWTDTTEHFGARGSRTDRLVPGAAPARQKQHGPSPATPIPPAAFHPASEGGHPPGWQGGYGPMGTLRGCSRYSKFCCEVAELLAILACEMQVPHATRPRMAARMPVKVPGAGNEPRENERAMIPPRRSATAATDSRGAQRRRPARDNRPGEVRRTRSPRSDRNRHCRARCRLP
jgi:hypothetical protein